MGRSRSGAVGAAVDRSAANRRSYVRRATRMLRASDSPDSVVRCDVVRSSLEVPVPAIFMGSASDMHESSSASGAEEVFSAPCAVDVGMHRQSRSLRLLDGVSSLRPAAASRSGWRSQFHFAGLPTDICSHCHAIVWKEERVRSASNGSAYSICCKAGRVSLPLLKESPAILNCLLDRTNVSALGRRFRKRIRGFNSAFAFTSLGAKVDRSVLCGRGPYTFRIHGQNYHRIGCLLPSVGEPPRYAQIYIYDTAHEASNRLNMLDQGTLSHILDEEILDSLKIVLDENNPYVKVFRSASQRIAVDPTIDYRLRIVGERGSNGGHYSVPTCDEVAVLMVGDAFDPAPSRDVIIGLRSGGYKSISEIHPAYMPLQYPLLFPYGEDGWHPWLLYDDLESSSKLRSKLTMEDFYSFRLQQRDGEGQSLLRGGPLLQQFIVDAYASVEEQRLRWLRNNQTTLRCDLYSGLFDASSANDVDLASLGRKIILPSSFTGSPRYMFQNYQDAMCICSWAGPPDLFITFTCNPKWQEILGCLALFGDCDASDRPDVVSRVFHIKLQQLLADLLKRNYFGVVIADVSVVEFQKRGLPHAHILLTLDQESKINCVQRIDSVVCCEIPSKDLEPVLHDLVLTHMIHGPCGLSNLRCPCMKNGLCSKKFPKKKTDYTMIGEDGFISYSRRCAVDCEMPNGSTVDDSWVVPYNRDLLLRYRCHINVEICSHKRAIKYLFKYVNKGCDYATAVLEDVSAAGSDEIKRYLDSRYIAASEAIWRLFDFRIQKKYPPVQRLQYHLPGEQLIFFRSDASYDAVISSDRNSQTMLTQWFVSNLKHPTGRAYKYIEYPAHFVWNKKLLRWTVRKRGFSLGRLPFCSPIVGERYYLRMLLNHVRGKMSFEDMRTVDDVVYGNFKEACVACGLLGDDKEWHYSLVEATSSASASQIRKLFCVILLFNEVIDPLVLWNCHWRAMSDDYEARAAKTSLNAGVILADADLKDLALRDIDRILQKNGKSLKDFPPLPLPSLAQFMDLGNRLVVDELSHDLSQLVDDGFLTAIGLNHEQKEICEAVMLSCRRSLGKLFFVYGAGGTGKTYLWKAIITKLRSQGKIVLVVASSGIASLLLPGGQTAHSRFKIPIHLHERSSCSVSMQTNLAGLIRACTLVIWDEAPMLGRFAFEAVDRTFRDIFSSESSGCRDRPFGGVTFVLGGDFRQILPVIKKGDRSHIVAATINKSHLWPHFSVHTLHRNMRVALSEDDLFAQTTGQKFADWLLAIGSGDIDDIPNRNDLSFVRIPDMMLVDEVRGLSGLIDDVYSDFGHKFSDVGYLRDRAILTCRNADVDTVNDAVLSKHPLPVRCYYSADSKINVDDAREGHDTIHTVEYLNSICPNGLPPHCLQLKVDSLVMLLRNLDQGGGLCNGTRLLVKKMGDRIIEAEIISGSMIGHSVIIPRIVMTSEGDDNAFILQRRQFPLRLCYAMTINKSQGQTLGLVGVYLPSPVFSHGMLYVAFSRVRKPSSLRVLLKSENGVPYGYTQNVVYKEVFQSI